MKEFYGYQTIGLTSNDLQLDCLATAGPRIVGLRYQGSPNLLAEVPEIAVATPYGDYHYLGGHRLWHAPESMPESYVPDDQGLTFSKLPDGLILEGRTEDSTGIRKRIEICVEQDQARVRLVHSLLNEGTAPFERAPWAITMFQLGGTAIIPLRDAAGAREGLLPDRRVALWPYSRFDDSRLHMEDDHILIEGRPAFPSFKLGTLNRLGWLAYWSKGILFRKSLTVQPRLDYPDLGCNAEVYCDSDFLELESLGPVSRMEPGQSATLTETWDLYDTLEVEFIPEALKTRLLASGRGGPTSSHRSSR